MAKGQKRSTREPRKPKQAKSAKSKQEPTPRQFLEAIDRTQGRSPAAAQPTGPRR